MRLERLIQDILPFLQERSYLLKIQIQSIRSSLIMQQPLRALLQIINCFLGNIYILRFQCHSETLDDFCEQFLCVWHVNFF